MDEACDFPIAPAARLDKTAVFEASVLATLVDSGM
jgi:hypothetical protein